MYRYVVNRDLYSLTKENHIGINVANWQDTTRGLMSSTMAPYLWPDQTFDTLFMAVAAGTVALNIIYEGLLLMFLSIMIRREGVTLLFSSINAWQTHRYQCDVT